MAEKNDHDQFVQRAMDLAFQWAHATYCKGLGRPYSDIEPIRKQLREYLTAGVMVDRYEVVCAKDAAFPPHSPIDGKDR